MIPNYPYFGLPNYMRYMNPQVYANSNQSYTKTNYYDNNTPPSNKFYNNANSSSRKSSSSANSATRRFYNNFYTPTSNIFTNTGTNSKSNSKHDTKYDSKYNFKYNSKYKSMSEESNSKNANFSEDTAPLISLFGINFYFDDVLLICILFFLYNENVNDPYLFFSLVLLLLS